MVKLDISRQIAGRILRRILAPTRTRLGEQEDRGIAEEEDEVGEAENPIIGMIRVYQTKEAL